jgi:hypothetical protein
MPLRTRTGDVDGQKMLSAIQTNMEQAFDQAAQRLVPLSDGAIDALRVVQGAIRESGQTARDLLRTID